METTKEICKNCRWFHEGQEYKECRHNSPDAQYSWPVVKLNDWCGKYEAKP